MESHDLQNVLIADDDTDDFELLKEVIEGVQPNVQISRAENGDILIRILDEHLPDLLFLDIRMPCKTGTQCLHEIRSNPKFDLLPVIMYSAVNYPPEIESCFRNGANLYTIKPTSISELTDVIKRIFSIEWKKALFYPPLPNFVLNPK
jgi:CheY-like chemotaxis protein